MRWGEPGQVKSFQQTGGLNPWELACECVSIVMREENWGFVINWWI